MDVGMAIWTDRLADPTRGVWGGRTVGPEDGAGGLARDGRSVIQRDHKSPSYSSSKCPDKRKPERFCRTPSSISKEVDNFSDQRQRGVSMAEGGSHWSLLAFERNTNVFVHHDSSEGFNIVHSKRVYRSVVSYVASDAKYIDCSTPRQVNGYDCGLYVTAIAREICEWYVSEGPKDMEELWFSAIKGKVTPSLVSKMRNEILELVRTLMVKQ
ncbi:hypothetical protein DH2020_021283 [Rehmannia glutinosa]|uniref:Ubiquitin-like protease family profile domain-containing protein n=1 Tax=Rehmannia glutinosa TaxID=99300 RepID=A0ABR0WAI8_REHGL